MALSIRSRETARLARGLACRTSERITDAINGAPRERLQHERAPRHRAALALSPELLAVAQRIAALPVHETRPADIAMPC